MYYGTFEEHMRCEHLPYSVHISRPTPEGDSSFKQSQLCLDLLPACKQWHKTQELDHENAIVSLYVSYILMMQGVLEDQWLWELLLPAPQ